MIDHLANLTCDVCGRGDVVGVASSCLGAISFAFCGECLQQRAEPAFMLEYIHHDCGQNVAEWVKFLSTWLDGRYIGYEDFVAHMQANPDDYPDPFFDDVVQPDYDPLVDEQFSPEEQYAFRVLDGEDPFKVGDELFGEENAQSS